MGGPTDDGGPRGEPSDAGSADTALAEAALAEAGRALAARAAAVLPRWLEARTAALLGVADGTVGRVAWAGRGSEGVLRAAREAAEVACAALAHLAATDVDDQRTTPLAALRQACALPASALRAAGVPPPRRTGGPPGSGPAGGGVDPYDLAPASWRQIDEELAELALVWGAAKARAHRQRHGSP